MTKLPSPGIKTFVEFMAESYSAPVPYSPPPLPSIESLKEKYFEAKKQFEASAKSHAAFHAKRASVGVALVTAEQAVKTAMARLQGAVSAGEDEASFLKVLRDARADYEDAKALASIQDGLIPPRDPNPSDVEVALRDLTQRVSEAEAQAIPADVIELLNRCYACLAVGAPMGNSLPTWEEWLARTIPQRKENHPAYRIELLAKHGVDL